LFLKTLNAGVGDLFMTLIHTCERNGIDPFDYLTELQRHFTQLAAPPGGGCFGTTGRTVAWLKGGVAA